MIKELQKCRICGNTDLDQVLNLGNQCLTGVFPKAPDAKITCGPLALVKCREHGASNGCGLLQLKHSYDLGEMYGDNYGYRSGLNQSMVKHLHGLVAAIRGRVVLKPGDLVIDIGSNDSTLLQGYADQSILAVGIDPTGSKFSKYYPAHIRLLPTFFSSGLVQKTFGSQKAKVVTSIAMFYDLESPLDFMRDIHAVLDDEGIWVFEQSYMPEMLRINAYDTICHEHLEYYGLRQIKWMTDRAGFKILDVVLNNVNGGSFLVMVAKNASSHQQDRAKIDKILLTEEQQGLSGMEPYKEFEKHIFRHREDLKRLVGEIKAKGKTILGYGASTKGNVILQFCGFTNKDIPFIAEVNEDKLGSYTPATGIPIISESEARAKKPDYFMVLPWHFRDGIVEREKKYLESGGRLLFPLPFPEIVQA